METVAVYCEPKLRTYGFKKVTDLSLLSWATGSSQTAACGLMFQKLGETGLRFRLVAAQGSGNRGITIHLLLDRGMEAAVQGRLQGIWGRAPESEQDIRCLSPVEMLFFHGPHYGDRYGIADLVLCVLARESVPIVLSACSASSIYLVFPDKEAQHVVAVLSEAIEIPKEIGTHGKDPREKAIHDYT